MNGQEAYEQETKAYTPKQAEAMHALCAHPGWEYQTVEGQRKAFDAYDTPPDGEGWEVNTDRGRDGWDRFEHTEERYWRRRRQAPLRHVRHKHGAHGWHEHEDYDLHQQPIEDEQIDESAATTAEIPKVSLDPVGTNGWASSQPRPSLVARHLSREVLALQEINDAQAVLIRHAAKQREELAIAKAQAYAKLAQYEEANAQLGRIAAYLIAEFPNVTRTEGETVADVTIRLLGLGKELATTAATMAQSLVAPIYDVLKRNGLVK